MNPVVVAAIVGALGVIAAAVIGVVAQRGGGGRSEELRLADELRKQLGSRDTLGMALGATARLADSDAARVDELLDALHRLQSTLDQPDPAGGHERDPSALLEYARGLLAKGQWPQAAAAFDQYVAAVPNNWEAQFARGTAYANARVGAQSERLALRAYNEALAFVPRDENHHWISRFYGYRGAMLKRLGRLDEARNDLNLALAHASMEVDRLDAFYNLAAVYAMSGKPQETIEAVAHLVGTHFIEGVRAHEDDYFASVIHDPRFRRLVE